MIRKNVRSIEHLPGVFSREQSAGALKTHFLDTDQEGEAVLFLHGNASTSTFWEEVMVALPAGYRGIAPDLRGYGLTDPAALVDARRGVGDWVDDIHALLEMLSIDRFHLVGHSMGGMIGWGVLADDRLASRVLTATLVAPGPPCGFGGLHGADGEPNNPDFSGSGAGLVHGRFLKLLSRGERRGWDPIFAPRSVMNRAFWKPPFRAAREEDLLSAILQVHVGEKQFPGDVAASEYWPEFAPGEYGPLNAMSGKYNTGLLRRLIEQPSKPPLLVVIGADDIIIADASPSDVAVQGKMHLRRGWPGDAEFPPQPFRSQVRSAFERYGKAGAATEWVELHNCGHTPFIEKADEFRVAFHRLLAKRLG